MYNIITVGKTSKTGSSRKGKEMEGMTNEQFNTVLKMIIEIINGSSSKEEAIKKIEALIK